MAVLRTNTLNFQNSTGATNTQSFNCTGGTTLVVFTEDSTNTAGNTTGVTYNGVSMTEVARAAPSGENREVCCWALHNPAGGANNIVATRTTTSSRFILGAVAYSGTDTSVSIPTSGGYVVDLSGSTATSVTHVFGNDGNDAIAFMVKGKGGSTAASTGSSQILTYSDSAMRAFESDPLPSDADQSCSVTFGSGTYAVAGIALQEAASTIEFDNATQGGFTNSTTHTFSHTCTGDDRILFVHSFHNNSTDLQTGVTYNGVPMTLVNKGTPASDRYGYLWYLIGPDTGANDVVITASSSTAIGGNACSYTGADQSSQPDASSVTTSSTSPSVSSVTTVADNCWTILAVIGNNANSTASTNSTLRAANATYGDGDTYDNNGAITPAGSYSMTVTHAGTNPLTRLMASFQPATTSTFVPRVMMY